MDGPLRLVEVARASNIGRVRSHNEDRSLARPPLLAVADGMGGAQAGEVAAQIAVDTLREGSVTAPTLRERLVAANDRIRSVADDDPSRAGMGTTLTAALLDDDSATIVHVGDSRAYLFRDGHLRQITDDHSIVAEMVRQGQLSAAEAERHPSRNIITRALGAEPQVQIDETHLPLTRGDVLLLCTDGLSSLVRDPDIEGTLADAADLDAAAAALVSAALAAGGSDNVTVVIGRLDVGSPAAEPTEADDGSPGQEGDATAPIVLPPRAEAKGARTPEVLEPTTATRGRAGRVIGLIAVVLLLLAAFGAWAGSRTYFVDGDADSTVRVYHGAPLEIAGLRFYSDWADTGVGAAAVHAAAPGALGRAAHGQGEAVRRAVDLTWEFGLPTVPEITVPPPPPVARPAAAR